MSVTERPSTAEIAASIDGFYNDFADGSNADSENVEDDAEQQSSIEAEDTDRRSPLEKARQVSHATAVIRPTADVSGTRFTVRGECASLSPLQTGTH